MRIVGIILLVAGLMIGIGENLPAFVDIPSLIIIATFVLGVLLISGTNIGAMCAAVFTTSGSPEELAAAARGWALTRRASLAAGYVGTLIGAIIILANIDDIGALGPGFAIGIMTVLYGLIFGYGICLPCQKYIEARAGH